MTPINVFENKKAVFYTLGCKLNFAETSTVSKRLQEEGMRLVQPGEVADVVIINTCSVTEVADHKCRQAISRLSHKHPGAFVVVTGCYAQLQPDVVKGLEGVDLVLGAEQKGQLLEYLEEYLPQHQALLDNGEAHAHMAFTVAGKDIRSFAPSCSHGDRTRYFLKVQDGCDYYCTYCTIPFARGRSRNGSIASIVAQAEQAAEAGGKEIVITGVNIGDFGKSTGETFEQLVRQLDAVKGIQRYRISSIEPNLLTDEIIDFCAQSNAFMPHYHIPLQSGSNEVLKLMHRRYTTEFFADKIRKVMSTNPDTFIGVDVIVGTRGETPELFEEAYRFIESLEVSQLHVFSYSERPGTMALKIPHVVSPEEKHERSQRLLELSERKRKAFYSRFRGQIRPVLLEKSKKGHPMHGFTDNYIKVELPGLQGDMDNQIVKVQLGDFTPDGEALTGVLVD